MSAPHVVSVEGDHRPVLLVPGRLWVCNCGWVSDQALGGALWLLLEARFWAEQWSAEAIQHGGGLDWWAGLLPWETPEAEGVTAEDMA